MKDKIKIGSKVRVENHSDLLRGRKGFEDFEGKVISIFGHIFGCSGEIKTEKGIRVFDTTVHKIISI